MNKFSESCIPRENTGLSDHFQNGSLSRTLVTDYNNTWKVVMCRVSYSSISNTDKNRLMAHIHRYNSYIPTS